MRDMLRYLFKPKTNDPEAIKSAYYESVGPTHVTMIISFLAAAIFLTITFVFWRNNGSIPSDMLCMAAFHRNYLDDRCPVYLERLFG